MTWTPGPWTPIQHSFRTHPKTIRAGTEGAWWFVCAVLWCDTYTTDGVVPAEAVGLVCPHLQGKPAQLAADRCEAVGLVAGLGGDGGYLIHDYADHQRTSAEIDDAKRRNRERQAAWRATRRLDGM